MDEQTPQGGRVAGRKGRRAGGSQGGRVAAQRERSAWAADRSTTSRSVSARWNGRTGPSQARTEIERQAGLRREQPVRDRGFGLGASVEVDGAIGGLGEGGVGVVGAVVVPGAEQDEFFEGGGAT